MRCKDVVDGGGGLIVAAECEKGGGIVCATQSIRLASIISCQDSRALDLYEGRLQGEIEIAKQEEARVPIMRVAEGGVRKKVRKKGAS